MDRIEHKNYIILTPHRLGCSRKEQRHLGTRYLKVTTSREVAHQSLDNVMIGLSSTPEYVCHHPTAD